MFKDNYVQKRANEIKYTTKKNEKNPSMQFKRKEQEDKQRHFV